MEGADAFFQEDLSFFRKIELIMTQPASDRVQRHAACLKKKMLCSDFLTGHLPYISIKPSGLVLGAGSACPGNGLYGSAKPSGLG